MRVATGFLIRSSCFIEFFSVKKPLQVVRQSRALALALDTHKSGFSVCSGGGELIFLLKRKRNSRATIDT